MAADGVKEKLRKECSAPPLILSMALTSSSSSSSASVRVLEQSRVSPPNGSVSEVSIPLTFLDINWIHAHPVEQIFIYHFPRPLTYLADTVVPKLKFSLSFALQHFHPLAGNLRLAPGTSDQYEIHYKDGDSVSFTVAESHADLNHLSGPHEREFDLVYSLVPKFPPTDDHARPLLALQVTLFPNSGICIGLAIHHTACDGAGTLHLMKSWASSFRSGGSVPYVDPLPFFDRSVIPDPHGLYSFFLDDLRRIPPSQAPGSTGLAIKADAVCVSFSFSKERIGKLKQFVMAKMGAKQETSFHCSTFAVVCAFIWVCLVKARRYPKGERAHFIFAMDVREAVLPPAIKASYLGNCLRTFYVEVDVAELVKDGDGFRVAAEAIGSAIQNVPSDVLGDAKEWRAKSAAAMATGRVFSVAGAPRLGAYDTDFGWGRPCKFEIISIHKTGAMSLAESRNEAGGVEVGLVLPRDRDVMLQFISHSSSLSQAVSHMIRSSL